MPPQQVESPFKVLVTAPIDPAGLELLTNGGLAVDVKAGLSADELRQLIGPYHGLIAPNGTPITDRLIERAFNLKIIARPGPGLDGIDVLAAKTQGIEVVNVPSRRTMAIAEHTMALILALARAFPQAELSFKQNQWDKATLTNGGLSDKTLGVIGFGPIGCEVARRARAFGMQVVVNQRRLTPELIQCNQITVMDLHDLLQIADFVTLHLPLKPETRGLIDAAALALLKPGAYLVNTARPELIDAPALLTALDQGRLGGAALDMPPGSAEKNKLAQQSRVLITHATAQSDALPLHSPAVVVARQILKTLTMSEAGNSLSLWVLPLERVIPHEKTDPERVSRMVQRFKIEKLLRNPPLVMAWGDNYVVLDGATRVTALKEMGLPHVVAQVIPHDRGSVSLKTWNHIKQEMEPGDLLHLIESLPCVKVTPVDLTLIQQAMAEREGLFYMILPGNRAFIIEAAAGSDPLDAMNEVVAAYIKTGRVARTTATDFEAVRREFPNSSGLFVFPTLSIDQVLHTAQAGRVLPAGVTRFIISGRVLRMNIGLDFLEKEEPLPRKASWLNKRVNDLIVNRRVRYYEEPIYLLDE